MLAFQDRPSQALRADEEIHQYTDLDDSIGLRLTAEGAVVDVIPDKPAARAGIGPGMRITAVNQRRYSADVLREEIRKTGPSGLLDLLVANGKQVADYKVNYHDGERYPVLERNNQPPLLDDILEPLTN